MDKIEIPEDTITDLKPINKKLAKLTAPLRAPSFEGYFSSDVKSFAYNKEGEKLNLTSVSSKRHEIEEHLQHIISLLREVDVLRMVVRLETRHPKKKRFLTVVESETCHSIVVGIDWLNEGNPTVGLVLPLSNLTESKLDGEGGLHVSRSSTQQHMFKPVSVQTLWYAKQIIDKAIDHASKVNYKDGISINGFAEYYESLSTSDTRSLVEWNEMGDESTNVSYDTIDNPDEDPEVEMIKNTIRKSLREVMRKVDLDEVTCNEVFKMCQDSVGMDLLSHKKFINEEMLVVMGQMDSASKILDYLYLGSEWNASSLNDLQEIGIGHILNITKEVDNFFPKTFEYYNIRVYDAENTDLLKHWDHTYRFIDNAQQSGSKVLVHCRYGISRSGSTVIAFLMKKKGWSMSKSLEYVKGIRNIVEPNQGFQKQLLIYEGILNSSRNRYSILFKRDSASTSDDSDSLQYIKGKRKQLTDSQTKVDDDFIANGETLPNETDMSVQEENHGSNDGHADICLNPTGRKRLIRAKTMGSGAVLIEADMDTYQAKPAKSSTARRQSEDGRAEAENELLEKVVKASEIKHQLIDSINELPTIPAHNDEITSNDSLDNNIKPSAIRKLSHTKSLDIIL